jgi:hypothetical protein
MSIEKERLLSLIEFAQHSARLKLNPTQDVSNHRIFHRFEHDVIGLPGVHFNTGGDQEEIWLIVDRLTETKAPIPKDQILINWLEASNNPEKEPVLKSVIELPEKDSTDNQKSLTLLSEHPKKDEIEQKLKKYISQQWSSWSAEEKKRRRTIKLYSELFTIKQQLEGSITDSAIELVWGIGIGVWKVEKSNIKYPLLTQLVELSLNEKEMTIEIRPRQTEIQLESDVYVSIDNPGITDLEKTFKELQTKQTQIFSPFDRITYESYLQIAVTHLDSKGMYWPNQTTADNRKLPDSGQELKVTDTWVLFARPRSKSQFIQDLERFKNHLDQDEVIINGVANELVKEPSAEHIEFKIPSFRGLSSLGLSCDEGSEIMDLYFPLPFNEEQVNIIQMLECSKGVVVQGPPGTGKTHSIANIISHYMACGKRVLVTSMKEPALSVLKEKLPETIQPLAIAILTNEQEGMKQFEFAVSKIAQELQTIDRKVLASDIAQGEQFINQLHAKLASFDRSITDWAKNNIRPFMCDGKTIYPEDAAREIKLALGQFEWLEDDISVCPENDLKINNEDVVTLRESRSAVANDLIYLNENLPEVDIFPDVIELLQIHKDLLESNRIEELLKNDDYPSLVNGAETTFHHVEDLLIAVSDFDKLIEQILSENMSWTDSIKDKLLKSNHHQLIEIFDILAEEITEAILEKNSFLSRPVIIPQSFNLDDEIIAAVLNKSEGKSAFGVGGIFGKRKFKAMLEDIRLVNSKPSSIEDWKYVYKFLILQARIRELIIRWNNVVVELEISVIDIDTLDDSIRKLSEMLATYNAIKDSIKKETFIRENIKQLCPYWKRVNEIFESKACRNKFCEALNYYLRCRKLSYTKQKKNKLIDLLNKNTGKITEDIRMFFKNIGQTDISDLHFQDEWTKLISELNRVLSLRYHFYNIQNICSRIKEAGGNKWATRLTCEPMISETDDLLPSSWQQAWRWRRLQNHLSMANCFNEFKDFICQRSQVEKTLSKTYQNIVANRTWLQLANNATPDIRAALQAFQAAIARIGKGYR